MRAARNGDLGAIVHLLESADLPRDGVGLALPDAVVAEADGVVVGAAALERHGADALLRSVVVDAAYRGRGIADALVADRLARAAALGVREVYLLTTTADGYFAQRAFLPIDRADVPAGIRRSPEFSTLCPATAVVMRRELAAVDAIP